MNNNKQEQEDHLKDSDKDSQASRDSMEQEAQELVLKTHSETFLKSSKGCLAVVWEDKKREAAAEESLK
jgi:hypothetical protein